MLQPKAMVSLLCRTEITLMPFTLENMEKFYLKLLQILLDLLLMNQERQWAKS